MSAFDTYRGMRDSTLRNAENAREEEFQVGQRNALRTAGVAYAGGDNALASDTLATNGLLSQAMQLDQQGRTNATADIAAGRIDEDRQRATVLAGAQGLLRLPPEQWLPTFTSTVAPRLLEVGIGQPMIDQILADGISQQELESIVATLGGDVEEPKYLQGARGALDVIDPYSGSLTNVRQAERESAPSGFRWRADGTGVEPIPGYIEGRGEVAGATRAPPRGRSGGGRSRGGGNGSSRPARTFSSSGISWD